MSEAPLRIIQISDTHLFSDPNKKLLGVPTQKSLEAVLEHIRRHAQPFDFIIHTGDLTQDYSEPAYQRLASMLTVFNVPVYCVPGNHDDPGLMSTIYPYMTLTKDRHIVRKHWQLILLDSHKPDAVEGYLKKSELDFMQHCLQTFSEQHAVVLFHHHPIPVGSQWLDKLMLSNADELWAITTHYPKLKSIFFGHVHQHHEEKTKGIACYSVPSTCIQFKRHQEKFGLEKLPQGYRTISLYPNGQVETQVIRIPEYIGDFDTNALGY